MLPFRRRLRKPAAPIELPHLAVSFEVEFHQGSFVAPEPWRKASGFIDGVAAPICRVRFGVSPLMDRIYVDGLLVYESYRRQGYARALLAQLVDNWSPSDKRLPVTALYELWSSTSFWDALRAGAVPGLVVTRDLRVQEMADEARRWRGSGSVQPA